MKYNKWSNWERTPFGGGYWRNKRNEETIIFCYTNKLSFFELIKFKLRNMKHAKIRIYIQNNWNVNCKNCLKQFTLWPSFKIYLDNYKSVWFCWDWLIYSLRVIVRSSKERIAIDRFMKSINNSIKQ